MRHRALHLLANLIIFHILGGGSHPADSASPDGDDLMLTHARVWAAIDRLAQRYNLSASGLARKAGLDATSFNKSKRISPEGRERWPSTESISKILKATGATLEDFLRLVEPSGSLRRSMIPLIGMEEAAVGKVFNEEGLPSGGPGWDEIEFPDFGQE